MGFSIIFLVCLINMDWFVRFIVGCRGGNAENRLWRGHSLSYSLIYFILYLLSSFAFSDEDGEKDLKMRVHLISDRKVTCVKLVNFKIQYFRLRFATSRRSTSTEDASFTNNVLSAECSAEYSVHTFIQFIKQKTWPSINSFPFLIVIVIIVILLIARLETTFEISTS